MIQKLNSYIGSVEQDKDALSRISNLENRITNDVNTIYDNFIHGAKIWQYQDFYSPVTSPLIITGFLNGSGLNFISGYIIDSSAVISQLENPEKPPTTTNNILTRWREANRVNVSTHTQTYVTLDQNPVSGQNCRLWFLINLPDSVDYPSGYIEAPSFVREDRLEYLDANYVNQYDDEVIYGVKTFDSKLMFNDAAGTRTELGLGSSAVLNSEYFAAYHELTQVSGVLNNKITASDAGVSQVNGISGLVNIISSKQELDFSNSGQNIDLSLKPQNSIIYRDIDNNITGIKYNNNFAVIKRNNDGKITGVYYNNYIKKILYQSNNITGVSIIYI